MLTRLYLSASLCLALCTGLFSQQVSDIHDRIIEALASSSGNENLTDLQSVIETLEKLADEPVNINTATADELKALPFLTEFEVSSIISYRDENGPFLSVYELQLVHGLDVTTAQMMLPYISVDPAAHNFEGSLSGKVKGDLLFGSYRVIQKSRGYLCDTAGGQSSFEGGPWRLSSRISLQTGGFAAGLTMEKDPGESIFSGSNRYGFDFYSANLQISDAGILNMAVAGDYRLQFGQGLTLWNGFSPGKSSAPLNIIKRPGLLKPYSSYDEDNFLRGLAVSGGRENITLTLFFSQKHRDATVYDTLDNGVPVFGSFTKTGYHRTTNEINKRNTISEKAAGTGITYSGSFFRLGAVLAYFKFDGLMMDKDHLYEVNDFSGKSLINAGVDYSIYFNRIRAAGEISTGNGSLASINSIVLNSGKFASLALSYRHYPARFYSLYSSALSEGSEDKNESGLYLGTVFHPARHFTVSAYADFFRFPWMKRNTAGPSSGSEYLILADFDASEKIFMSVRLKFAAREPHNVFEEEEVVSMQQNISGGFRYDISYGASENFKVKLRADYVNGGGKGDPDNGFMIYQDLKCGLTAAGIVLRWGYAYFATESFSSRIYIYEPQVVSSYSASPLYGRGHRSYLMAQYNLSEKISFWIRFSGTWYNDRSMTGSGYSLIDSNKKYDVRFQVKARF